MYQSAFHLLKTRRFLPIFATQFLGSLNDNVFKNAVVILIAYTLTQNAGDAQLLVTIAAGIFILPFFLFSATAGQFADKLEKSALIVKIKWVEVFLSILAAFGFLYHSTTLLMTVLFLLGTQAAFFGPLKYAILPEHLAKDELIGGTGLVEGGTFLSILVGTIIGGILIVLKHGELIVSLTVFMIAVLGLISSYFVLTTKENPEIRVNYNFLKETYRLIHYSIERRELLLCILGISWFWLVGAVFLAEFPVFTKDIVHGNENVVTFFIALFSVGIASGSLLCNRILAGEISAKYVPYTILGVSIFILDLFFAANQLGTASGDYLTPLQFLQHWQGWRICLDLFLISLCGGLYTVPLYALLQIRSEPNHRARVIASNNVVNAFFMVAVAIATVIFFKIGLSVNHVFLIVGITNLFMVLLVRKIN